MKDWQIASPGAVVCVGAVPPADFAHDVSVSGGADAGPEADGDTPDADFEAQTGTDADSQQSSSKPS